MGRDESGDKFVGQTTPIGELARKFLQTRHEDLVLLSKCQLVFHGNFTEKGRDLPGVFLRQLEIEQAMGLARSAACCRGRSLSTALKTSDCSSFGQDSLGDRVASWRFAADGAAAIAPDWTS